MLEQLNPAIDVLKDFWHNNFYLIVVIGFSILCVIAIILMVVMYKSIPKWLAIILGAVYGGTFIGYILPWLMTLV